MSNKPVREIVYAGNGKDAELTITCSDGSTGTVASRHVLISSTAPMQLTISSLDDLNLAVRISGLGLAIAAGRVANYDADDEEFGARFRDDVAQWAEPGCHDLGIVTPVELELTAIE
ncbi:hypothetical protein HLB23_23450 [Nocardia uniformis]|uniref:Uncharacterized protein n=1 Tax=Nocardia uniformis TaxID=53432 RepID=A0A849C2B4_9NOCA|nr:hypothetical protein [Nocardia uniformis]NNH72784.1 hypothetical protein [Nocardia uniformis]